LSSAGPAKLAELKAQAASGEINPKTAKVSLARELVARFHTEALAAEAAAEFENVFRKKNLPVDIPEVPSWGGEPMGLCRLLADHALTESTSAARRLIKQGAVTVNGEKVSDTELSLAGDREYLIKVGKKRYLKVRSS
jgi:tyrosyl-tRNA synthetase